MKKIPLPDFSERKVSPPNPMMGNCEIEIAVIVSMLVFASIEYTIKMLKSFNEPNQRL